MIRIGIIGAGAGGMMAAATLLECGFDGEIYLFDKNNKIGKKVALTGGGRCNVTTSIDDKKTLLSKYIRGSEFVKIALGQFSPKKVREWFESNNLELKIEEDQRVFPVSDNGEDVVAVFENKFNKANNLHLGLSESVKTLDKVGDKFLLKTDKNFYEFDYIVIATGGNAYSHTGSSGDGYNFAKQLGHAVTKLGPSLNSFVISESWVKNLKGLSFENSYIYSYLSSGKKVEVFGPILFTHFGITGPAVFALSAYLAFEKIDSQNPKEISFVPKIEKSTPWDKIITKTLEASAKKQIDNILYEFLPNRFVDNLLLINKIEKTKKASYISKQERLLLSESLSKGVSLSISKRRPADEFVTAGGVDCSNINKKTMESKICENLFFCGEVVNVDAVTGGFNLQGCWSMGRLAAQTISAKTKTPKK